MNKKGQDVMEFFITYGWVFLLVFTIVGPLFYFGVFGNEIFYDKKAQITQSCCDDFCQEYEQLPCYAYNQVESYVRCGFGTNIINTSEELFSRDNTIIYNIYNISNVCGAYNE